MAAPTSEVLKIIADVVMIGGPWAKSVLDAIAGDPETPAEAKAAAESSLDALRLELDGFYDDVDAAKRRIAAKRGGDPTPG